MWAETLTKMTADIKRHVLVLRIHDQNAQSELLVDVFSNHTAGISRVREDSALRIATALRDAGSSIIWYWSEPVFGYSTILNGSNSMWVYSVPSNLDTSTPVYLPRPGTRGYDRTRVMPLMHSQDGECVLLIGTDMCEMQSWADHKVDVLALSNTVRQRLLFSASVSGRCYCCQMVCNIHNNIKGLASTDDKKKYKVKLERGFRQRV